jgi:hypothetical protein
MRTLEEPKRIQWTPVYGAEWVRDPSAGLAFLIAMSADPIAREFADSPAEGGTAA